MCDFFLHEVESETCKECVLPQIETLLVNPLEQIQCKKFDESMGYKVNHDLVALHLCVMFYNLYRVGSEGSRLSLPHRTMGQKRRHFGVFRLSRPSLLRSGAIARARLARVLPRYRWQQGRAVIAA